MLYDKQGLKIGPDGQVYPKNATDAEMQRLSKHPQEPPASEKAFPVGHYPANPDIYCPRFEVFAWKPPQRPEIGGIEDGPARRAGVHYGDFMLSVNGFDPIGESAPELERLLSSTRPVSVTLAVDRDGEKKVFTFELVRASEIASMNYKRLYEGHMIPSTIPAAFLHCFSASKASSSLVALVRRELLATRRESRVRATRLLAAEGAVLLSERALLLILLV